MTAEEIRAEVASWPEKHRASYEERAGILEFMANMPRPLAERQAYQMEKKQMEAK